LPPYGLSRQVLASSGYLELGMLDDAAMALEEIAPEDKSRHEVLGARVVLYMAAKKWDMAAAIASHLVKVEPENETLEGATALLIARNCRSLFSVILSADALGSVHEFRDVLFERELIYAWDGERTSPWNDQ
jgi:hypothetical protein